MISIHCGLYLRIRISNHPYPQYRYRSKAVPAPYTENGYFAFELGTFIIKYYIFYNPPNGHICCGRRGDLALRADGTSAGQPQHSSRQDNKIGCLLRGF